MGYLITKTAIYNTEHIEKIRIKNTYNEEWALYVIGRFGSDIIFDGLTEGKAIEVLERTVHSMINNDKFIFLYGEN